MNLQELLKQAGSLKPTATVVRDKKGRVRIEREELLTSSEREEKVAESLLAGKLRFQARTKQPESAAPQYPILKGELYTFDGSVAEGGWKPCRQLAENDEEKSTCTTNNIRVATFNVWFSEYQWELRLEALVNLLVHDNEEERVHIICLQEVTPRFLTKLLEYEKIRNRYLVAHNADRCYGVLMLVDKSVSPTIPEISWVSLPTQMGRSGLIASLGPLAIGTVHLESLKSKDVRTSQLQLLYQTLSKYETAVLCGDFNISATGPWADQAEHEAVTDLLPDFDDLWTREHGHDADSESEGKLREGVTYDTRKNSMLRAISRFEESSRYDRVYVKDDTVAASSWCCHKIRIIGDQPIQTNHHVDSLEDEEGQIFISDHFCLLFEITKSGKAE